MSIAAMKWARAQKVSGAACRAVLNELAWCADEEGICWPSQETIAENTGLSRSTIVRAVKVLKDENLLEFDGRRYRLAITTVSPRHNEVSPCNNEAKTPCVTMTQPSVTVTHHCVTMTQPSERSIKGQLKGAGSAPEGKEGGTPKPPPPESKLPEKTHPDGIMVFEGQVIRLRKRDFDAWLDRYGGTYDQFFDWLNNRDEWFSTKAKPEARKRWFISTSAALQNLKEPA